MGFTVLSYFNATEFGAGMEFPPPPRTAQTEADLWRDPNDFLYARLGDAVLLHPDGGPYWTWGAAVVMDPGEPIYQQFLVEQAQRHLDLIPASSGICIDRTDWLRVYNTRRDDGVSWFKGRAARSLLMSWRELMGRLGPLLHGAGKVIFSNLHLKRIEMHRHVDGFFDEFTYHGGSLNTCAFLGLRKPVLGWVEKEENLQPDADAFLQRYLYLGVYPMAPFPGNDHSIEPSPWAERYYLDYGPLFAALRGKKWVLRPHVISVEGTAKANVFQVAGGYVIPVTFGGDAPGVRVVLRSLPGVTDGRIACRVIHPGDEVWQAADAASRDGCLEIAVPLCRGCALVRVSAP